MWKWGERGEKGSCGWEGKKSERERGLLEKRRKTRTRWGRGEEKGIKWEKETRGAAFQLQGVPMNCLRFGASTHSPS